MESHGLWEILSVRVLVNLHFKSPPEIINHHVLLASVPWHRAAPVRHGVREALRHPFTPAVMRGLEPVIRTDVFRWERRVELINILENFLSGSSESGVGFQLKSSLCVQRGHENARNMTHIYHKEEFKEIKKEPMCNVQASSANVGYPIP